jgi:hypothetical protein
MLHNPSGADDEGIRVTYSALTPGQGATTPFASPPHDAEPEPGTVRASHQAWPRAYHRLLNAAFLGAVLVLGVLVGTVMSGSVVSFRSASTPSHTGLNQSTTRMPAIVRGGVPNTAAPLDARFAIVSLGIQCMRAACSNGSWFMPAGQHIYSLQAGVSCTTATPVEVVNDRIQYVYCRLDQPDVYTSTFDGTQFACTGSRLGCHFVLRVATTNGR